MRSWDYLSCLGLASCLLLTGCGDDGGSDNPVEELGDVCAEQHTETIAGREVVACDTPFDEAPFVRLPDNTSERVFAEFRSDSFVDTNSQSYGFHPSESFAASEDQRHAVTLYAVTLEGGIMKNAAPAVVFDDRLFLAPFLGGAYEGKITQIIDEEQGYDEEPTLDVRLEIGTETEESDDRSDMYVADATFANLTESVTNDAGDCMPSLASFGENAPFEPDVEIVWKAGRVPSMHSFGEDQFVFYLWEDGKATSGSLMGMTWYRGPLDIVNGTVTNEGEYYGVGHGTPSANPTITLQAVSGGGEPCTVE